MYASSLKSHLPWFPDMCMFDNMLSTLLQFAATRQKLIEHSINSAIDVLINKILLITILRKYTFLLNTLQVMPVIK